MSDLHNKVVEHMLQHDKFSEWLGIEVTEIKEVYPVEKKLYKLIIDTSKIALRINGDTVVIGCFLQNQFYKST